MKKSTVIVDPERRFILSWILFLLTFSSGLLSNRLTRAATSLSTRQLLESGLEDIVRDRLAAEQIGRLYLAVYSDEENFDRLAGDLLEASQEGDSKILKQRIAALRVRDFANEDIAIIDGWVLARVEARICALMHILRSVRTFNT